ncbi:MAG: DUF72 domain-containing protein [Polyangiaceae bacterium]|jgi:uncharacterized protein YecE (DUF72 family)
MRVLVGTSGYSYKEWKGPFYPKDLKAGDFLRYYGEAFPTVEINNTFYRMPTPKVVSAWATEVPESFIFAVKAPQRITHIAKLEHAQETLEAFVGAIEGLGPRLGPLLFQLPPFLRKDVARLDAFLALVPKDKRVAFEFRHPSWFDEDVWRSLRSHGAALCVAEGEALESPLMATASWGYLRLRRTAYPEDLLNRWAQKIRSQAWDEAFVYLKHDEGDAPSVAKRLTALLG